MCADWRYSSAIVSSGETIPSVMTRRPAPKSHARDQGASAGLRRLRRMKPWVKSPIAIATPARASGSGDQADQSSSTGVAASSGTLRA